MYRTAKAPGTPALLRTATALKLHARIRMDSGQVLAPTGMDFGQVPVRIRMGSALVLALLRRATALKLPARIRMDSGQVLAQIRTGFWQLGWAAVAQMHWQQSVVEPAAAIQMATD